ncbi:SDR family NAD(P)-dependent oxidoreductase [Sphingomonas sp. ID1715]|uniref:SDR family NAD(P)-dependent oxidoreductase n=1 Tax=Sphingomonas sp. ID1715 TaxID=1656898 RepID=UPI0014886FE7|nr:SDR family NAD(P)-dependent oxidoreductase [Sphingomonas sp. ID1715]NNM77451.1 SDR family NAD(P)-dependent oxidoreductase [Sphingomonas sp. ID1715]
MFEGKRVWITGASSGIGAALAAAFAGRGARLVLSGRRRDALAEVAAAVQPDALLLPFEATDWAALPEAVAAAGDVDVLVNNAGISQRSLAVDTRPEVYKALVETDLLAPIWLTQLVLPAMVSRGEGGHIVGISSVAGRLGTVLRTGYCAAKHGLIGYLDALRAEVEQAYGIKVTTVLPGSVRTQVAANALQADGSARGDSDANIDAGMDPAECARRILVGLTSGAREIIVAEGGEAFAARLRFTDPERLFDMLAKEGARLADERARGARPDPAPIRQTLAAAD